MNKHNDRLAMGIVGMGRIGQIHFANLQNLPGIDLVTAVDPTAEARALAEAEGVRTYANFEALLEANETLDAVVICSPTDEHAHHVVAAARQGWHVFCEKPLDLSLDTVHRTLDVAREAGIQLMLGFNRRFDPSFAKVKALVDEGRVGELHLLHITSRDPAPPPVAYIERSGGLFLDMTIHDFDMARHLVGAEVREVYARGCNRLDPAIGEAGDIDTAVCLLSFENGVEGVIDNSRQAVYGYDQRVEVFGSKGAVSIGNETPDRHQLCTVDGVQSPLPEPFFLERYAKAYELEMEAFVSAVQRGDEVPVSGHDGLMALKMGLAAKLSVLEKRPVRVSEIG